MILNIPTTYQWGDPTFYVQKIYNSLLPDQYERYLYYDLIKLMGYAGGIQDMEMFPPKKHAIIENKEVNYIKGSYVHFCIKTGKQVIRFLPPVYIDHTHDIELVYTNKTLDIFINGFALHEEALEKFVKEEGCDGLETFKRAFPRDIRGELILWGDSIIIVKPKSIKKIKRDSGIPR